MSNNRLLIAIAAVGVILVTAFSVEAGLMRSSATPNTASLSTVRQPSGDIPLNAAEPSDYIQRHPDLLSRHQVDLSDYYLRHPSSPGAPISASAVDLSDYFQRHPESLRPMNGPDMSDWFQRHSDWTMH